MAYQSNIEVYVRNYLKKIRNTNNRRSERRFIEKAIKMIEFFLGVPCCEDPDATVSWSRFDNYLTNDIRAFLIHMDRRRNRKSLEKALQLLRNALADPCCFVSITSIFDFPIPLVFEFFNVDTEETFSVNGITGSTTSIPKGIYDITVSKSIGAGNANFIINPLGLTGSITNINPTVQFFDIDVEEDQEIDNNP